MEFAAIIISVLAAGVAAWSIVYARRSANAARESVAVAREALVESRRSADAAEGAVVEGRRSADAAERSAAAAEATLPPPVAWRIRALRSVNPYRRAFALRNCGTRTATGVRVVWPDFSGIERLFSVEIPPTGVGPGAEIEFSYAHREHLPSLRELKLTWDGQDDAVAVPIPAQ
ncbi:hypothetical protein GCM10009779_64660 [Polymorphospora rubra]|uniref:Uncharacterized protein n=1 Tax=Polymorphospora rubra TaxID=338584 RepID=A0A810MYR0_9ACTN|nr:hypothetical protein Prubr_21200 [Polymorphospora rubra]